MNKQLYDIEISKIFILNPRERNKQIAGEIRKNIEDVGLKRPITITRKQFPQDGYEYPSPMRGRMGIYKPNLHNLIRLS